MNPNQPKTEEKKDIFDIIIADENGEVLWVSDEEAMSEEGAYLLFVQWMKEEGRDLEYFMPPTKVTCSWGRWEQDDDDDTLLKWIEDEENGQLWYRLTD